MKENVRRKELELYFTFNRVLSQPSHNLYFRFLPPFAVSFELKTQLFFFSFLLFSLSPKMLRSIFLIFTLAYISIPVDAKYPCHTYAFVSNCCGKGNVDGHKFNLITETHPTHSCVGFNSSVYSQPGDLPPLLFGTWEGNTLSVRLMTGLSPGLCLENFGMPVVGYCGTNLTSWGYTWQGCSCELFHQNIVCSDKKITEAQFPTSNSNCEVIEAPPSENDYHLYTQEECQNYLDSLPFDHIG